MTINCRKHTASSYSSTTEHSVTSEAIRQVQTIYQQSEVFFAIVLSSITTMIPTKVKCVGALESLERAQPALTVSSLTSDLSNHIDAMFFKVKDTSPKGAAPSQAVALNIQEDQNVPEISLAESSSLMSRSEGTYS